MKLYRGEQTMQMVDKEQVEACLEAGWSRTKPEPVESEPVEPEPVEPVPVPKSSVYKKVSKAKKIKTSRKR